jgi:hypothetical protein
VKKIFHIKNMQHILHFIKTISAIYNNAVSRQWCGWLRHCATNHKVTGSIPDVTGIY